MSAERPDRGRPWLAAALFAALAAVLLAGSFRDFDRLGGKDWNAFLGQAQAETSTLLDFGQFPGWNPWRRGGQVSFAQPESMFLSPVTPLALLVGANAAFKLWLLPLFVLAGLGLFALAGDFGLRGVTRLLPGAAFVGASVLPLYVNGGLPNWLFGMAILPWLLLSSRRAASSRGWLVAGAALYAALLFCGNVHHFVFFPLVLGLEAAARSASSRSLRPLLATAALGITGAALSLVRLVPLLELFSEFPRELDAGGRFMPLSMVGRSLLWPHPPGFDGAERVVLSEGSALYWVDCGAYVGPVVAALALLGIVAGWRRSWPCALIGVAFLWLALGSSVKPSLWDALRTLPVYGSMQAPERFMGFVAFAIALLAGFGGERVEAWLARFGASARRVASAAMLVSVVVPLLAVNSSIADSAFPVEPPRGRQPSTLLERSPPPAPFRQAVLPGSPLQWGGPLNEAVLANTGNVEGQSDVPSKQVARAQGDLLYRGEIFLAGGHGEVAGEITPNRIEVRAKLAADDVIVVNQTYFPGWERSDTGEPCTDHAGLIAVALPAGEHAFALEFAPRSIPAGAILTLLSLLALALGALARRRAAGRPREATRIDVLTLAAQALLVASVLGWFATRTPSAAGAPPTPWRERAITVDPSAGPAEVQRTIDAAKQGDVLRLLPGDRHQYGSPVIRRGITLVADPVDRVSLEGLTIEGLAADERLTVIGPKIGQTRGAWREGAVVVRGCEGFVFLALDASHRTGIMNAASFLDVRIEKCLQVFLVGSNDAKIAHAKLLDSHCAIIGCGLFGNRDATDRADAVNLETRRSTVLITNRGGVERMEVVPDDPPDWRFLDHSTVRADHSTNLRVEVDSTSSFEHLAESDPSIVLFQPFSDGHRRLQLSGPAGTRGTLIVGRRPAIVPLKGSFAGQFLGIEFDGRQTLFPFELGSGGSQMLRLPVDLGDPGEGLFFQAYIQDGDDPATRRYSLMDCVLALPLPDDD